jgi:hypothetical protein
MFLKTQALRRTEDTKGPTNRPKYPTEPAGQRLPHQSGDPLRLLPPGRAWATELCLSRHKSVQQAQIPQEVKRRLEAVSGFDILRSLILETDDLFGSLRSNMPVVKKYEPAMNKTMRMHAITSTLGNGLVHVPDKAPGCGGRDRVPGRGRWRRRATGVRFSVDAAAASAVQFLVK